MWTAHRRSRLLTLLVLSLAPISASGVLGLLAGVSLFRAQEREKKEILVKTPWGRFQATETSDPSRLGLPVYHGAKFLKGEAQGTLDVNLSIKGKPEIHFLAGKFQTQDSIEQVRDFYKRKQGQDATKFTEKTDEGGMAFEIKGKSESKYVQLKRIGGVTEIDLLRIEGLQEDAN